MSDEEEIFKRLKASLAGRDHLRDFAWVRPDADSLARHLNLRNLVVHSSWDRLHEVAHFNAQLRHRAATLAATGGHVLTTGGAAMTDEDDTLTASATVDPPWPAESCAESPAAEEEKEAPIRPQLAMPPGYRMAQLARCICFFSPKSFRVFEEGIDDYRFERIEAEAKGCGKGRLRMLDLRHWVAFGRTALVLLASILGPIIKVLRGG